MSSSFQSFVLQLFTPQTHYCFNLLYLTFFSPLQIVRGALKEHRKKRQTPRRVGELRFTLLMHFDVGLCISTSLFHTKICFRSLVFFEDQFASICIIRTPRLMRDRGGWRGGGVTQILLKLVWNLFPNLNFNKFIQFPPFFSYPGFISGWISKKIWNLFLTFFSLCIISDVARHTQPSLFTPRSSPQPAQSRFDRLQTRSSSSGN